MLDRANSTEKNNNKKAFKALNMFRLFGKKNI